VVKLMEEEDLLLTAAYVQLQMMKKTKRNRMMKKKMSVWIRDWLQRRVLYTVSMKSYSSRAQRRRRKGL